MRLYLSDLYSSVQVLYTLFLVDTVLKCTVKYRPMNILINTDEFTFILLISCLAFVVSLLLTPVYTYFAFKYKLWKQPRTHSVTGDKLTVINKLRIKRTIPRMAGIITVVSVTIVTVLFNLDREQTWLPLTAFIGAGMIGLADDYVNVKGLGGKVAGLSAKIKVILMSIVGGVGAWWFYDKLDFDAVQVPYLGSVTLGLMIIPLFILIVVTTSNAVNMSDGVDGLAGGLLINAFIAFAVITALQGNYGISAFCMTIVGALLSYTWFNIAPARFIMGDIGSFSLGAALGIVAMQSNTLLLLPIIGFLFVLEGGSTLLQVLSKKLLGKKIFIAAPLHHHLEAGGWPKTKVTMRFWVLSQVCAVMGVLVAITGGFL